MARLPIFRAVKHGLLKASKTFGLVSTSGASQWRRNRLLILGYHGVSRHDEHMWDPEYYMSQEQFAGRMQMVRDRGCNVLPLGEAVRRLYRGDLPPKSVVITFDDGLHDFYANAYPILERQGFPATVYQTTYYCTYNRPVFDVVCSYLLWKGRKAAIDGLEFTGHVGLLRFSTKARRDRLAKGIRLHAAQLRLSGRGKDALAQALAARLGIDFDEIVRRRTLHLMTPGEIATLARRGVEFQLHTHRHRSPVDRNLFYDEIRENRRILEALTSAPAVHFSYPNGIDRRHGREWLERLNIVSATTSDPGLASRSTDRFLLPRLIDTSLLSAGEFEAWLSGLSVPLGILRREQFVDTRPAPG
jgi:peptidoglycan/xylan/chitin deacetylase (PgdA/CDA1 family)